LISFFGIAILARIASIIVTSKYLTKVSPSIFLLTNLQTSQEPKALFQSHFLLQLVALLGNQLIEVAAVVSAA
jgi:hypothetical protein